jgi:hypothetical protein
MSSDGSSFFQQKEIAYGANGFDPAAQDQYETLRHPCQHLVRSSKPFRIPSYLIIATTLDLRILLLFL